MSKKKKIKPKKPPLSFLDKCIYRLFALITVLPIVLFLLMTEYIKHIFFEDQNVVALEERATFIFLLIPCLMIMITLIVIWDATYGKKKAIFPNKKINYKKYGYQYYPVFYKGDKPKREMTRDRKKYILVNLALWSAGFIICCALGCLGIFGRTELTRAGQIIKYSVFNNIKEQYYISDISEVEYSTYLQNVTKGPDYYTYAIAIKLKNSDEYFHFNHRNFDDTDGQSIFSTSLDDMKYLRDSVYRDKKITYNKEVDLKQIVNDYKMTQEEIEKLYEFFNQSKVS